MDDNETLKDFGRRLRIAREAITSGMSQEELGEAVGTTKSAISAYENGKTDPRYTLVQKMSDALGVSFTWLATGRNVIEISEDQEKSKKIKDYIDFIEHQEKLQS